MESLFEEIPTIPKDETEQPDEVSQSPGLINPEDSLAAALPIVQAIVRRRKLSTRCAEAEDVEQGIALRLWKWLGKFREKSEEMSPDEWQSFAARTTYNEINRYFASAAASKDVPLDAAPDVPSRESIEGESGAEIHSLVNLVWQEICNLSLRQRKALLLHNQELIIYFLQTGINDEELAQALNFTADEWIEVKGRLPLSDFEIANLSREEGNHKNIESKAKSIKKARHEARLKLRRLREK